jgi:hypothetical protein
MRRAEIEIWQTVLDAAIEYWGTHTSKRALKSACMAAQAILDREKQAQDTTEENWANNGGRNAP